MRFRKRFQKAVKNQNCLLSRIGGFHGLTAGNLLQLLQRERDFAAAPFLPAAGAPAVNGQVAGDFSEKGCKDGRASGRHGVPSGHVGVAYTFFGIFVVCKDVIGDRVAKAPVFGGSFGDRVLRAAPKQSNDFLIVHSTTSFLL